MPCVSICKTRGSSLAGRRMKSCQCDVWPCISLCKHGVVARRRVNAYLSAQTRGLSLADVYSTCVCTRRVAAAQWPGSWMGRGATAAATWVVRGWVAADPRPRPESSVDGSRRRRGRDLNRLWTSRGDAGAGRVARVASHRHINRGWRRAAYLSANLGLFPERTPDEDLRKKENREGAAPHDGPRPNDIIALRRLPCKHRVRGCSPWPVAKPDPGADAKITSQPAASHTPRKARSLHKHAFRK